MADEVKALIAETKEWRDTHRKHGRLVEAAACAIRITALKEALKIIEGHND